jgi:hypothetical protein
MKKILLAVVAFLWICAFGTSRVVAQGTPVQTTVVPSNGPDIPLDQQTALLRKDIVTVKKQLISTNLTLTDSEAAKFWPVYDQYCSELDKINDTRAALIKEYTDRYETLTDEQADSLVRRWLDTDIAASELRQKYVSILRKVLPGKTVATFFQLERRISMMIDLQLTSQLPLVQGQD